MTKPTLLLEAHLKGEIVQLVDEAVNLSVGRVTLALQDGPASGGLCGGKLFV